jgi:hypothetical protein
LEKERGPSSGCNRPPGPLLLRTKRMRSRGSSPGGGPGAKPPGLAYFFFLAAP